MLKFPAMKLTGLVLAFALCAAAQNRFEFWPGATYDPAIPTEKAVLGHDAGDRISAPEEIIRYMEALAAASQGRMKVFDYGKTWEGRRLIYAVLGSPANMARLDGIQAGMQQLADPRRTPEAEARKIMSTQPAVVWLAYGVHGNEISSSDAALQTAYHMLASRNDALVDQILGSVVLVIDPMQNPDGRGRFVHNFEIAEGSVPDASPLAAEHNEPWPGGRTNHYFFDMNRDWFALTQPETRGRIQAARAWYPVVFVDLHEMGSDSTYYFAPEATPYNPHIMGSQRESLEWFGRNNAKWFDKYGFSYFTREGYDEFYPGYGASWPLYFGSIAMTYEQGSTRGLVVRRADGVLVNYRDTVRQHFVASISTAETAVRNREKLLANFYNYRKTAIEEGTREPVREYILPREGDVSTVDKLASNLVFQGVEVKRATAPFRNAGREYPAGSYVIPLAQPSKRLIRTLLDPQVSMEKEFLQAEEKRRAARLRSEMYDVTAWSIPLQYNISAMASSDVSQGSFEEVKPGRTPGKVIGGKPEVAWLIPWGTSAAGRFLAAALRAGVRVTTTDHSFKLDGRTYPNGTLIVKVKEQPAGVAETIERLARTSGSDVYTTDTGWVDEGANFGSRDTFLVPDIKIALAWDRPTGASAAGATRFVLEREYDQPVTVVRTQQLTNGDLSQFNVIILPDAGGFGGDGYDAVLGTNGARRLKDWVQAGGTLIALGGGAVSYLADPKTGLLAITQENAYHDTKPAPAKPETPATPAPARTPGKLISSDAEFEQSIQPETELPDSLHGVLLRAKVSPDHWMTAGVPSTVNVLVSGRAIFTPIKLDKGVNAVWFAGPTDLLASGYIWEQNRKQLAYKPFVIVQREGRGSIVGFTQDPNYRGYMDGLNVLFLNAVYRGPARAH